MLYQPLSQAPSLEIYWAVGYGHLAVFGVIVFFVTCMTLVFLMEDAVETLKCILLLVLTPLYLTMVVLSTCLACVFGACFFAAFFLIYVGWSFLVVAGWLVRVVPRLLCSACLLALSPKFLVVATVRHSAPSVQEARTRLSSRVRIKERLAL